MLPPAMRRSLKQSSCSIVGSIVAVKGLGGFHLAVKATDEAAVSRLRSRKIREEKPFAVMFPEIGDIRRYAHLNGEEENLLKSPARPIVLLERRKDASGPDLAGSLAPWNRYLGVFLPYTPVHFLLFENAPYRALVMTSGNQSDEPIVMQNEDARSHLEGIADYFLFHDREIYMRCDDSVGRVITGAVRPVRRARGYAPQPVFLRDSVPSVLGVGAELKNTVCLTRGREAFVSQHIGDLENLETLGLIRASVSHLERILEIEPELIVHDLHPDYLNTQWAQRQGGLPRLAVQHHHAHIAAVMAERGLDGAVVGLALDGTGFGTDGTIWGGEILRVDNLGFERLGHVAAAAFGSGEFHEDRTVYLLRLVDPRRLYPGLHYPLEHLVPAPFPGYALPVTVDRDWEVVEFLSDIFHERAVRDYNRVFLRERLPWHVLIIINLDEFIRSAKREGFVELAFVLLDDAYRLYPFLARPFEDLER